MQRTEVSNHAHYECHILDETGRYEEAIACYQRNPHSIRLHVKEPTAEQWEQFHSMGDLNRDGYIDRYDLGTFSGNYGKNIWEHFNLEQNMEPTPPSPIGILILLGLAYLLLKG